MDDLRVWTGSTWESLRGPKGDPGDPGPPGPTEVSADGGNASRLGSDGKVYAGVASVPYNLATVAGGMDGPGIYVDATKIPGWDGLISADQINMIIAGSDGKPFLGQASLDQRYVLADGDTMTGPLQISYVAKAGEAALVVNGGITSLGELKVTPTATISTDMGTASLEITAAATAFALFGADDGTYGIRNIKDGRNDMIVSPNGDVTFRVATINRNAIKPQSLIALGTDSYYYAVTEDDHDRIIQKDVWQSQLPSNWLSEVPEVASDPVAAAIGHATYSRCDCYVVFRIPEVFPIGGTVTLLANGCQGSYGLRLPPEILFYGSFLDSNTGDWTTSDLAYTGPDGRVIFCPFADMSHNGRPAQIYLTKMAADSWVAVNPHINMDKPWGQNAKTNP